MKKLVINDNQKVKVTQIGSPIGRNIDQRSTLIGLGLGKMHKHSVLLANSSIVGMIRKVAHLVKVENI
jgi:large subunit ribosomal protein L30